MLDNHAGKLGEIFQSALQQELKAFDCVISTSMWSSSPRTLYATASYKNQSRQMKSISWSKRLKIRHLQSNPSNEPTHHVSFLRCQLSRSAEMTGTCLYASKHDRCQVSSFRLVNYCVTSRHRVQNERRVSTWTPWVTAEYKSGMHRKKKVFLATVLSPFLILGL